MKKTPPTPTPSETPAAPNPLQVRLDALIKTRDEMFAQREQLNQQLFVQIGAIGELSLILNPPPEQVSKEEKKDIGA